MSRICELFMDDELEAPGYMVSGDPKAPLLIIAMAPGREELERGTTLIGPSGTLLWKQLLKKAGLSRADCYTINAIGEWPNGPTGGPSPTQLNIWWDVFDRAVARSKAKVALLLGGDAFHRFTGITGGIEDWRGYIIRERDICSMSRIITTPDVYKTNTKNHKKGDPKITKAKKVVFPVWPDALDVAIPTIHPAAVLRTGFATLPVFAADLGRVGRAIRGDLRERQVTFRTSPVHFTESSERTPVAFDIETGGIGNDIITRIGVAKDAGVPVVWTAHWDRESQWATKSCLDAATMSIAYNISFDAPRLAANGVHVPEPWWDAMLAAATLKPDLRKGLNYVSSLYLDTERWKHLSDEDPAKYNAWDVARTLELFHILRPELDRTNQLHLFEKRMMPSLPTLVRMTQRGIKVDSEMRGRWIESLTDQLNNTMAVWSAIAPGVKTSGSGLLKFLYQDVGLPIQYHKHGGVTSEMSGLRNLLVKGQLTDNQSQVIETLLKLRGIQKELRTYAEVDIMGDGCVHPSFLPAGKDDDRYGRGLAGTGRISSSGPNIQNQTQAARRMYIPRRADMVLGEFDFSQIEARIIAQVSGDKVLEAAIEEGLHESNQRALGVDKTRAKNGFYGWAYGAGKRTLSRTFISKGYDIGERECQQLLDGLSKRFAAASAWRQRIAAEVSAKYYLSNPFGRRRYFMGGGRDTPAALDFIPQSCAADIMWTILRQIEDGMRGYDAALLATVHDSVLIEVNRRQLRQVVDIVQRVMTQPWPELGDLSIPVGIKTGENWGEMCSLEL